ncbi:methyltransferase TRM13-domain-containing protein [Scheffersomyces amazonensis]|uniref:methyltransferase TRM13-domain-containing protein n=1 Tax=Scheffersomyces amazonensis TaxID=1078765 RepID=UPI00315D657D
MREIKRRKTESEGDSQQCEYFLEKKKRQCGLKKKPNHRFCSEHMIYDVEYKEERVPCPLDGNHTVWLKDLQKHLKKCNAKPKDVREPWYSLDYNSQVIGAINGTDTEKSEEDNTADAAELLNKYISLLQTLSFPELPIRISQHEGLDPRLHELKNQKHALQQSSLIGNMKHSKLLDGSSFYLEFGCGKGELSRYINLCVMEDLKSSTKEDTKTNETYGFGFIDRGVNRMKVDSKIVKEASEYGVDAKTKRSRIDIKDLNVDKFIEDINPVKVVCISKHLCGAATDLTLKSLLNSTLLKAHKERFGGLMIAMCCRHVCSYEQLLPQSRKYLAQHGFKTIESFNILKKAVSWAVCGTGKSDTVVNQVEDKNNEIGLNQKQREEIGFIARRLVDESRVFALQEILPEFDVQMFLYSDMDITLENVCLSITPRNI